jgi:hypothetical protein
MMVMTSPTEGAAEEPKKSLPTSEIAKRAGMTINEWRDVPRKITRLLRAHFPGFPRGEGTPRLDSHTTGQRSGPRADRQKKAASG